MTEDIYIRDSENNIQFLKSTLDGVDNHLYTVAPAEGKWSIQLILDHLAITEAVIVNLSKGPSTETDREPTANVLKVKTAFNDHQKVYPNPKPVSPTGQSKSATEFLTAIEETRHRLLQDIKEHGAYQILDLFAHPLTGKMTRLEWLYFNIYHTERHIHQIKMIQQNPILLNS